MNKTEQKIVERIDQLLTKAAAVKAAYTPNPPNVIGFPTLDEDIFNEWKVGTENLIQKTCGEGSPYFKNFILEVKRGYKSHVDSGIGMLRALREDIEQGYLSSIHDLVKAEIFSDYLEVAQHLLDNNYKDPAASLIGATLENGLKDIATKNNIVFNPKEGIDDLNKKLAAASLYNALIFKQVDLWRSIRNSADHGKFKDYSISDVSNMKNGVENFLGQLL